MSDQIKNLTDATFDEVIGSSDKPVVVDFWADWCGPCKAMAPALDQVASELAGKLKVVKIDVDENPKVTQGLKISAMPTLIMFKDGKAASQKVGAAPRPALEAWTAKRPTPGNRPGQPSHSSGRKPPSRRSWWKVSPRGRPRKKKKKTNGMEIMSI